MFKAIFCVIYLASFSVTLKRSSWGALNMPWGHQFVMSALNKEEVGNSIITSFFFWTPIFKYFKKINAYKFYKIVP